jgi:hypothetical protein
MTRSPARKPAVAGGSVDPHVPLATLNELALHLADQILRLESERGARAGDSVMAYVAEAVTVEIRHRRRTTELTDALSALERGLPLVDPAAEPLAGAPVPTHRSSPAQPVPSIPGGERDTEETFYRALIAARVPVHLRCFGGYEADAVILRDVGASALLVETADGPELFLKRSIISVERS